MRDPQAANARAFDALEASGPLRERVLITLPGKIGDALLQWPCVYHWNRETGRRCVLGMPPELRVLDPLFRVQPAVEEIVFLEGIQHFGLGGQPYDFGLRGDQTARWGAVYHLGFRAFPDRPVPVVTRKYLDFKASDEALCHEPSLRAPEPRKDLGSNFAVLHALYNSALLRTVRDLREDLEACFDRIYLVGLPKEQAFFQRGLQGLDGTLSDTWVAYPDTPSYLEVANLLAAARVTLDATSSIACLANALKVPCLVAHHQRHIGTAFHNTGPGQVNLDYRSAPAEVRRALQRFTEETPA